MPRYKLIISRHVCFYAGCIESVHRQRWRMTKEQRQQQQRLVAQNAQGLVAFC